jgi:hypothetical protein
MYRPRLVVTDWPQSITRLQGKEPSKPIILIEIVKNGYAL